MVRKCKAGKDSRPAYFHGWFRFGTAGWSLLVALMAFVAMFLCVCPAAILCHHPNPLLISFLSGLVFAPLQGAFTAWKLR